MLNTFADSPSRIFASVASTWSFLQAGTGDDGAMGCARQATSAKEAFAAHPVSDIENGRNPRPLMRPIVGREFLEIPQKMDKINRNEPLFPLRVS